MGTLLELAKDGGRHLTGVDNNDDSSCNDDDDDDDDDGGGGESRMVLS